MHISIISNPVGTPVNGSNNVIDYPILTSVSLLCNVTTADGSPVTVTSYSWTASHCYDHTGGVQSPCFYSGGHTGYNITGNSLLAPDAGTVSCTVTIGSTNFTSDPLTLRISGKQLWSQKSNYLLYINVCILCTRS